MVAAADAKTSEQHFVLTGVDWAAYDALLRGVADRHVFVTYDRGTLELLAPSWKHENRSEIISQLIRSLAEGFGMKIKSGGSTTFRREDSNRGLEPDKCFYVKNESLVRSKKTIDLSTDPPPDLCLEIEISRRILDRAEIYETLGVPELWRDNGRTLRVFTLGTRGKYEESEKSVSLPKVTSADLNELLALANGMDEIAWAAHVRKWARHRQNHA